MKLISFLFKSSIADFRRNKIRTFLTSLGILIGVLSVVLLIALGVGLRNYIEKQFEDLGSNVIYVFPGQLIRDGQFRNSENVEAPISFDEKDVRDLQKLNNAQYVVPVFNKSVTVSYGGSEEYGDLYATTADIFAIRNLTAEYGEIFSEADVSKRAKVVVMGPKIAEKVFESADLAVGRYVRLNDQRYRVIGVTAAKGGGGGFGGPDFDSYIYTPYSAASSFNPDREFASISVQAFSEDAVTDLKDQMQSTLEERYEETDFTLTEQKEILEIVSSIFGIINSVLIAIGSISLVVGGIGIMNIMYATVTERTKEIGIRRAIGATKRDILLQFLAQSLLLSLIGGLGGLLLAFLAVLGMQAFFPAEINPTAVVIAVGISSIIGVFFGVFPARKAANLSPIEAIRYE